MDVHQSSSISLHHLYIYKTDKESFCAVRIQPKSLLHKYFNSFASNKFDI